VNRYWYKIILLLIQNF